MPNDNLMALTWTMFVEELATVECGEAFALQILTEAREVGQLAGITVEQLIDYARRKTDAVGH